MAERLPVVGRQGLVLARVSARERVPSGAVGYQEGSEILQLRNYLGDDMNGRFPRTMQQAFGPYTDDIIYEETEGTWAWVVVSFVAMLAMLVIVI